MLAIEYAQARDFSLPFDYAENVGVDAPLTDA